MLTFDLHKSVKVKAIQCLQCLLRVSVCGVGHPTTWLNLYHVSKK